MRTRKERKAMIAFVLDNSEFVDTDLYDIIFDLMLEYDSLLFEI